MTPAARWLRGRLSDSPADLLEAMVGALPQDEGPVSEALAFGAMALYGRVLTGTGGREDALPLLAADALLTHAIEAQAESDPAGLAAFVERWGAAGRLGALVHQVEP
jgi:hypothetical protein